MWDAGYGSSGEARCREIIQPGVNGYLVADQTERSSMRLERLASQPRREFVDSIEGQIRCSQDGRRLSRSLPPCRRSMDVL